jgi:hypothetical protein
MSNLSPTPDQAPADDLLYGFDIPDEETKLFLSSLIASGQVPQADLNELQQLSLARGVEEWDMLFDCASVLRERSGALGRDDGVQVERSLVPFLGAVLGGRAGGCDAASALGDEETAKAKASRKSGASKKKGPRKGVSHFWGEEGDASETVGLRPRAEDPVTPGSRSLRRSQEVHVDAIMEAEPTNGALIGFMLSGAQDTSASLSASAGIPRESNGDSSDTAITDNGGCPRLVLPDRTAYIHPEPLKDAEPAVKARGGSKSPFFGTPTPAREKKATKAESTPPSTTRKKTRPLRGTVSGLPIPPLSADRFGLIQEELAGDPFRLLIAITFLIRTTGKAAIPVFRELMERCPTPQALAAADPADIIPLIHPLGLSAVRCAAIQKYAHMWLAKPPRRDVRYGVKNYPQPGDGRHVRVGEEFGPEDNRGGGVPDDDDQHQPMDVVTDAKERGIGCAWEIGHLTQGPYALDSWRIFCRDVLLGRSGHWTGKGSEPEFQPEWMRVLPRDKELRACLRWMWYVSSIWLFLGSSASEIVGQVHGLTSESVAMWPPRGRESCTEPIS